MKAVVIDVKSNKLQKLAPIEHIIVIESDG